RTAQQGTEEPTADKIWFEDRRAEGQLGLLLQAPGPIEDFLEVGGGAGRLMRLCAGRLDARAVGIEPGAPYREFLPTERLLAYRSLEELCEREPERRFDVISLSHVLEHLPDPVDYLFKLGVGFLKPGGRIYVEVPNLLAHTSFEPGHLYSFTVDTLRRT